MAPPETGRRDPDGGEEGGAELVRLSRYRRRRRRQPRQKERQGTEERTEEGDPTYMTTEQKGEGSQEVPNICRQTA